MHMKWSKTIQFREKVVQISFSYVPHSPLCPVKAIRHAFPFYLLTRIVPKLSII